MSKQKSFERRRAQDIRCQVKKEYVDRIEELRRDVIARDAIIVKQEKVIKELKMTVAKFERERRSPVPTSPAAQLLAGFGGYSGILNACINAAFEEGSPPCEPTEESDSPK